MFRQTETEVSQCTAVSEVSHAQAVVRWMIRRDETVICAARDNVPGFALCGGDNGGVAAPLTALPRRRLLFRDCGAVRASTT